ncbi:hypothetical protein N7468_001012 [Penicillium chermesinum]|uniref:Very-long-chain (3R)-3-hydroxyacyl-CoA dehydratase n=1 Tax=Penicillium chermesinum TaxID=63820 RepID=A0A9W9PG29_9EURO|nr:uncharacterized protein N7468_001012 [Penicillium chermesinum]KAJ5246029.1 hypothetical protein N7468_001012 [Penicillium chermesinum]KAJ6144325.1 hypothetical protein N7470_008220 [Penicillium chermesinum]
MSKTAQEVGIEAEMAKAQPQASSPSRIYLLLYNAACAALWAYILLLSVPTWISAGTAQVYSAVEPWVRLTQSLAVAEILHAATGITRAPVFTTFTQVFARSVQVWAINHAFPGVTAPSAGYPAMVTAWALADTVRYLYFAVMLAEFSIPRGLKWLRYSLFTVLYPVGIGSEWWLMYQATTETSNWAVQALFYFFLGLYIPGTVMMFSYMLKQRRKMLASL